jgi:integrase/recombinase XerD
VVAGRWRPFADGYKRKLVALGHKPTTVRQHLRLMGQLSGWLAGEGLGAGDLTRARAEVFLDARRTGGQRPPATMASMAKLLDDLIEQRVVRAELPAVASPRDVLVDEYRRHLIHDRGLSASTVSRYARFAKQFLSQRASRIGTALGVEGLSSAEVNAYLLLASSRLVVDSAKREAADLRALLRFLYLRRVIESDLGAAMPPVAAWRGARLPRAVGAADVDAVLGGCDRSTASGRRDYAILCLLARLGLRRGEVAALRLDDVDWRRGEISVRGKARRVDRLPLPVEVGEALVAYLREGRPACGCRQLFVTVYAPYRPINSNSITDLVYRACRRAGLARVGGHRLRHALATQMLRRGGDLIEIAQVLRHSDLGTTSGYAKVDRAALRIVAQPWPGARR